MLPHPLSWRFWSSSPIVIYHLLSFPFLRISLKLHPSTKKHGGKVRKGKGNGQVCFFAFVATQSKR